MPVLQKITVYTTANETEPVFCLRTNGHLPAELTRDECIELVGMIQRDMLGREARERYWEGFELGKQAGKNTVWDLVARAHDEMQEPLRVLRAALAAIDEKTEKS